MKRRWKSSRIHLGKLSPRWQGIVAKKKENILKKQRGSKMSLSEVACCCCFYLLFDVYFASSPWEYLLAKTSECHHRNVSIADFFLGFERKWMSPVNRLMNDVTNKAQFTCLLFVQVASLRDATRGINENLLPLWHASSLFRHADGII